MSKKNIIYIIIALSLIIAAGLWYWNKNTAQDNKKQQQTAFETGFVLLDDEKGLAWTEAVQLAPEARSRFESEIIKIKADLAVQTSKDDRLADYNNLAIYEKYLGNYKEAYDAYLESIKLENRARVAWQNFADVLFKIKAYKSAEMAYKRAIDLNKYIPESYNKLADFYQARGEAEKAEETYKLAIETIKQSFESDTLVLGAYADWLEGQKRYDDAIKILRDLLAKQPENKEAIERRIEELRK